MEGIPGFWGKIRVYVRFLRFLKPYRRKVLLLVLLAFVGIPLGKLSPMVAKFIVDDVLTAAAAPVDERVRLLFLLLLAQAGLFLVGEAVRLTQSFLGSFFWLRLCVDFSKAVYGHMHRLSADFFMTRNVGEHMYRANSDITLQNTEGWMTKGGAVKMVADSIPSILMNAYSVLWAAIVLWMVSPALVGWTLLYMIPYSIGFMFFFEKLYRSSFRFQRTGEVVQSALRDAMAGMKFLKSSGRVVRQERAVNAAVVGNQRTAALATFWHIMGRQGWINLMVLSVEAGLWTYATFMVLDGRMTLGEWTVVPALVAGMRGPAENVVMYLLDLKMQTVPAVRMLQTIDLRPSVAEDPHAPPVTSLEGRIELEGVRFGYRPDAPIVDGLDLAIAPGQRIGLVGPSGAGKSTVLNLILRLYDPQAGTIRIDGRDLRGLNLDSLLAHVGVVPQSTFLFEGSVRDNILFGAPRADDGAVLRAAELAGLADFLASSPEGLDTYLGEGTMISGGQKQRIGIARALVRDPALLIFDEATSSLDPRTESQVLETIEALGRGRTTITVAHRLRAVRNCDVVFVLEGGRVAESGSHDALLAADGVYARMWRAQMDGLEQAGAGAA